MKLKSKSLVQIFVYDDLKWFSLDTYSVKCNFSEIRLFEIPRDGMIWGNFKDFDDIYSIYITDIDSVLRDHGSHGGASYSDCQ